MNNEKASRIEVMEKEVASLREQVRQVADKCELTAKRVEEMMQAESEEDLTELPGKKCRKIP